MVVVEAERLQYFDKITFLKGNSILIIDIAEPVESVSILSKHKIVIIFIMCFRILIVEHRFSLPYLSCIALSWFQSESLFFPVSDNFAVLH